MAVEFKNPDVKSKYVVADPEQRDCHIHVPKQYAGPLSGISLEAADQYVEKENGKLIKKIAAAVPSVAAGSGATVVKLGETK